MTFEERLQLAIEFNKQWIASRKAGTIATKNKITLGELSPEDITELTALYPDWESGIAYKIGDQVMFEGKVWESLINANVWSPTAYPQGWKEVI